MTQSKSSQVGDYFGTFLDTLNTGADSPQQSSEAAPPPAPAEAEAAEAATAGGPPLTPAPAAIPPASRDLTAKAVSVLSGVESMPVAELQSKLSLGFTDFGAVISTLHNLGMVVLSGEPGAETIGLTTQGRLFSQMK